jgi:GNAT superfamily N-acetyltransferase
MIEDQIAALTISAKWNISSAVKPLVISAAESVSLDKKDSAAFGEIVEQIVLKLMALNSTGEDDQSLNVSLSVRCSEFVVTIEHKGLPIEVEKGLSVGESPFSLSIQSKAIDNVRLINSGKSGQRFELSKLIPHHSSGPFISGHTQQSENLKTNLSENQQPVEIRLIRSSEGLKLARLFYWVYGFTYGPNYVYNPEHLNRLVMDRRLVSAVAVDSRGEFCAHAAILLDEPDNKIGELISLAVDPNYRESGLAKKLHSYLVEQARERRLKGLFAEAVTIHPFSQRLCLALSGKESAMMLGYIPPANYRQISDGPFRQRQMAIVYFFGLSTKEKSLTIFVPNKHILMIERIYSHLRLKRKLLSDNAHPVGASCGDTAFDLKVKRDMKSAAITLQVYCPDTVELVGSKLKGLLESGIEYVSLDLPLSNISTPYFANELESMGFFFSGVIPYLNDGDSLRLQFLNTSQVNLDSAIVVSAFGEEMSEYVKSMKERAPNFQERAVQL